MMRVGQPAICAGTASMISRGGQGSDARRHIKPDCVDRAIVPLAHDARRRADDQRLRALGFMKAPHVGDRAIDRFVLLGVQRSFRDCELVRADFHRLERRAVETSRVLEHRCVAARPHIHDDLAYACKHRFGVVLRRTAQRRATVRRT